MAVCPIFSDFERLRSTDELDILQLVASGYILWAGPIYNSRIGDRDAQNLKDRLYTVQQFILSFRSSHSSLH